ncbi:redoxin domain-containing protein [Mesobacillus foraminis]|uniref:redoxin domain-containing protein n=1 Tax=Mesobacillus foraminis TaxID=279826 RepID=UPI001BE9B8AF|nr:redoxin domain-containing protein [Mesobacillus foraminis]MBT2757133.1 redoxin domain-containing protein [Mesobacillus foraminis]
MKKFLMVAASILAVLLVVDLTILKDQGMLSQAGLSGQYSKIANPEDLPEGLEVKNRAPDFTLQTLNGDEVKLSDYRGKKVLLNFWATWCPPCKAEMPYMQEMYDKYKKEGFEILAVNSTVTEKSEQDVSEFVKKYELSFLIPMDVKNRVSSDYEILAYPTSFFIDAHGVIRSKSVGGMTKEFLEKEIKKLP